MAVSTSTSSDGTSTPTSNSSTSINNTANPPGSTQTQLGVDPFGGGSTFGTSGLTQDTTAYNPTNATLSQVPTSAFNTANVGVSGVAPNPYGQGSSQANIYNDYANILGRAPDAAGMQNWMNQANSGMSQSAIDAAFQNSPEALTSARARMEVTPQIQSQIQQASNTAQNAYTQAQQQLAAVDPAFQQQYSQLQLGYNQNLNAQNQALSNLSQNYDVTSQRLGSQLGLIPEQAFSMANRRGMLDSSAAYEGLQRMALPVQNNLADLTRSYLQNRSTSENQLSNIVQKYQQDLSGLYGQRQAQTQGIQNQLSNQYMQAQQAADLARSQYAPMVASQSGQYGDLYREYALQQQQVAGYLQNLGAQQNIAQQQIGAQAPVNAALANYYNALSRK